MLPSGAARGRDLEYHPARQSDPEALTSRLELDGSELDLSLTRVGLTLDAERQKANVLVFHPGFATIPEQARGQATYLVLDWLLGEDGVERRLGAVEQSLSARPVRCRQKRSLNPRIPIPPPFSQTPHPCRQTGDSPASAAS